MASVCSVVRRLEGLVVVGAARTGAMRAALAGAVAVVLPLALGAPARGSFPGTNGGFVVVRPWTGADGVARSSLVRTDRNGDTVQRLDLQRRHYLAYPDWSPSGTWVTYVRVKEHHNTDQVRIVRADGTDRQVIRRDGYFNYPVWSPTGRRIAFWGGKDRESRQYITTVRRDGTHAQHLLHVGDFGDMYGMDWSSRNLLAFSDGWLFTIHPDGSGLRQVLGASHDAVPLYPDWSPGGRRLVYVQGRWRLETEILHGPICTIRADGTDKEVLGVGVSGTKPSWSPDGSQITYISYPDGALHTVASDGTGDTVIGTPDRPAGGVDWRAR
jgi:Tol biopolymer transport system component